MEQFLSLANQMMSVALNGMYELGDCFGTFKIKLLTHNARSPVKADEGAAGYDIFASEDTEIPGMERHLVPTGVALEVPKYCYVRIAPRSGLSCKGLDIGAGVVDSSYRGEVKILVINNNTSSYRVSRGDRIAQLIVERCFNPKIDVVENLQDTNRGEGGFGSTGK